jgi:hypothetical protein
LLFGFRAKILSSITHRLSSGFGFRFGLCLFCANLF